MLQLSTTNDCAVECPSEQGAGGVEARQKRPVGSRQAEVHDGETPPKSPPKQTPGYDVIQSQSVTPADENGTLPLQKALGLDNSAQKDVADGSRTLSVNLVMTDETTRYMRPDGPSSRPVSCPQACLTSVDDLAALQQATSAPAHLRIEEPSPRMHSSWQRLDARLRRNRMCFTFLSSRTRADVLAANAVQMQQQDLDAEGILTRDFALEPAAPSSDTPEEHVMMPVQSSTDLQDSPSVG
ncbi:hypothetical protein E4U57_004692 [Claviceps arundinis]|uniref:Uncharacterized protein n=1 Tax=Claviceps arundinis TaxID=1623583 RepID=A0ABQ7P4H1_9HYPO|nr:hypothetical protein E4U57_004692 [Claviceps arundinis]